MKKVINNRLYNTETAKVRGEWNNGRPYSDFRWCEETLYQKKTGEFFLHGRGGAASRYSEERGQNCWGSGERIIPLSVEAARSWAEQRLGGEEYEAIFGPVVEDETRVTCSFSLAADSLELLRRAAAESGRPMGVILDGLIKSMQ